MLLQLFLILTAIDLLLLVLAIVLPESASMGPMPKVFPALFSMPISILLAAGSGTIEVLNTAFVSSNNSFVTQDYVYTGAIPLLPFFFGLFFTGMTMTLVYAVRYMDFRRKASSEKWVTPP
jgi:hypothetical protein